jgi:hypothetical protein
MYRIYAPRYAAPKGARLIYYTLTQRLRAGLTSRRAYGAKLILIRVHLRKSAAISP